MMVEWNEVGEMSWMRHSGLPSGGDEAEPNINRHGVQNLEKEGGDGKLTSRHCQLWGEDTWDKVM
jgi:hypothetical protein